MSEFDRRELRESKVEVRIDELVLDGFAAGDQFGIAEGVRLELARLIIQQGVGRLAGQPARVAEVDAGSFKVPPDGNAGALGRRVAQAVHGGLLGGHGKR